MGPHPAVAAIRLAVRRVLHDVLNEHSRDHEAVATAVTAGTPAGTGARTAPEPLVLVACSGGADSMALASALAFESRKLSLRAGGITVKDAAPTPTHTPSTVRTTLTSGRARTTPVF
ncbi:hypothetical protein ABZ726_34525, partial [Streptomyces hundungensis]